MVSESPLGAAPQRFRFLARNRIIAALTRATLVVEAPIRSGALSTARHAQNIGRPVGAVPGPIDAAYCRGCIDLLRNDATAIASVAHLRELLGPVEVQERIAPDFLLAQSMMASTCASNVPSMLYRLFEHKARRQSLPPRV